jgi:hypothetical protein
MIDYIYRIQVRHGVNRFWETKYAVPSRTQAEQMFRAVSIADGWQKRLMQRDECIAQASS